MAIIRAQVILNARSGILRDFVTNTFHFNVPDPINAFDIDDAAAALSAMYTDLQGYLSPVITGATNGQTIKFYEVTPGAPGAGDDFSGSPIQTEHFTLATPNLTPLPNEVAIAVSVRAAVAGVREELGATRPAARRRGRFYFGPMNTTVLGRDGSTDRCYVLSAVRTAITASVKARLFTDLADSGAEFAVYSRADGISRVVEQVSVDDAFDTVRSRGEKAAIRTSLDF